MRILIFGILTGVLLTAGTGVAASVREAAEENFSAKAEISPDPVHLSGSSELTVTAVCPAGWHAEPLRFESGYGSFRVENGEVHSDLKEDRLETAVFHFGLIPADSGEIRLLPIPVQFRNVSNPEETKRLLIPAGTITVKSEFPPGTSSTFLLTGLSDMKERGFPWLFLYAALAVMVIFGVFLFGVIAKKEPEVPPTPSDLAMAKLRELKESGLAYSNSHEYYIRLTGIVRTYIEETTGIHAPEQTTEEFLRGFRTNPEAASYVWLQDELTSFLEFADLVKFARFSPSPDDLEEGYRKAVHFIMNIEPPKPVTETEGGNVR